MGEAAMRHPIGRTRHLPTRRSGGRARRAAFTLIEMMIALTAGLIAVTSIYYVSSASSRHFQEQQRVAQTQMSLRMAMEQLRRDLDRAGYLGTPNSSTENTCVTPTTQVRGVELVNGGGTAALTEAGTNNVTADTIRMTGNYATADSYLARNFPTTNQVTLQDEWQGFRRSFGVPYDADRFEEVFTTDRMLHIEDQEGRHFFASITGVTSTAGSTTLTFTPSLPSCINASRGAIVSPLVRIEYAVIGTGGAYGDLQNATSPLAGVNGPILVRREVQFNAAATPIQGTDRVVTEYVAELDVDFVVDTAIAPAPVALATVNDGAAQTAITNTPEQARSAIVRLSVRTAAEDPRFPFAARAAGAPLTHYELSTVADGSARVRTLSSQVLFPNFIR
jgi:prepilin-type N-terminal cleavage/methylation domain-containing protein